ncbi:hypothetical protein JOD24_002511 [Kroppenstedtia sanguinis]
MGRKYIIIVLFMISVSFLMFSMFGSSMTSQAPTVGMLGALLTIIAIPYFLKSKD